MNPKVLLVEDDPDTSRALTIRLEASGYIVVQANDSTTALGMAWLEVPDVIVLDLGLPDGDGYGVMKQLKSSPETAAIPVIVLTGRDPVGNQEQSYEMGAVEFYQKPVPWKWFLESLQRAAAKSHSESAVDPKR